MPNNEQWAFKSYSCYFRSSLCQHNFTSARKSILVLGSATYACSVLIIINLKYIEFNQFKFMIYSNHRIDLSNFIEKILYFWMFHYYFFLFLSIWIISKNLEWLTFKFWIQECNKEINLGPLWVFFFFLFSEAKLCFWNFECIFTFVVYNFRKGDGKDQGKLKSELG